MRYLLPLLLLGCAKEVPIGKWHGPDEKPECILSAQSDYKDCLCWNKKSTFIIPDCKESIWRK